MLLCNTYKPYFARGILYMGRKELSELNESINQRIAENISQILNSRGISQTCLLREISNTEDYTISSSQLSKALNSPDKYSISLPYLLQISDFFGIPLDTLLRTNLSKEDCIIKDDCEFNKLIDTKKLIGKPKHLLNQFEQTEKEVDSSSAFITDPNHLLFRSFLQTYYCYFYPTVSSENKEPETMLTGTLKLEPSIECCNVTFTIDTKKKENRNKIFKGTAVISPAAQSMHFILKSESIGEYCYIILRHFHLNSFQDCHMAEVLSTSSIGKGRERYPTVLRMFLSREVIEKADLRMLAPHLWLNYSEIAVGEQGLLNLKEISSDYAEIVDKLFDTASSENMYMVKEKDVIVFAKNNLDEADTLKFLTELRLQSYAYRYNKVSDTVETTVRNLLVSFGYYKHEDVV